MLPARSGPWGRVVTLWLGLVLVVGLLSSGCRPGGWPRSSTGGALGSEPPALEITCDGRVFENSLLGYGWPPSGRQVAESTALAPGYYVAQPGETFVFSLPANLPARGEAPRKVEIGFYPVSTTGQNVPPTDFPPLDSRAIEASGLANAGKTVSWSWVVPDQAAPPSGDDSDSGFRLLRVRVEWNDDTYCVYGAGLQVVQPGSLDGVLAVLDQAPVVAEEFFKAAWEGRQADVKALLTPGLLERRGTDERGGRRSSTFTDVAETSSWDYLLWRTSRVRLLQEPVFRVISVAAPEVVGPRAGLRAAYQVLATDPGTGRKRLYDFVETIGLALTPHGWKVDGLGRRGAPHTPEPARLARDGERLRCGPFSSVDFSLTANANGWDPKGTRLAFLAENHSREELWVVDVSSGRGRPVLTFPTSQRTDAWFLTWSADGQNLFFMIGGRQTFGPYKDGYGLWIARVPARGGDPGTVLFLAPPALGTPGGLPLVTADRSTVFICDPPDVIGVDLNKGEVIAQEKGLLTPAMVSDWAFSPDGWAVMAGATRTLVDFRSGTKTKLPAPPGQAFKFDRWTPDGLASVEWGVEEEVVENREFLMTSLAGATAISLLDPTGHETARLEAPAGLRIGRPAWAPDGSALLYLLGTVENQPFDPAYPEYGTKAAFVPKELWLWDRAADTRIKLSDVEESLYSVDWPVGPAIHLYAVGAPSRYLSISAEGGWHLKPVNWAATTPNRILGERAGTLVTAVRVGEPASYWLVAERDGRAESLALGNLRWGPGSLHAGRLTLEDWSDPNEVYVVIVPVPGEAGGG